MSIPSIVSLKGIFVECMSVSSIWPNNHRTNQPKWNHLVLQLQLQHYQQFWQKNIRKHNSGHCICLLSPFPLSLLFPFETIGVSHVSRRQMPVAAPWQSAASPLTSQIICWGPIFFLRHDWKTENGARSPFKLHDTSSKNIERAEKGEADTERWVTEAVTLWRHRVGVGPASASPAVSWELAHWSDTRTTSDDLDDRTIPGDRIEMWEAKDSIKNECCQLLLVTINESHKKPQLLLLVFSFFETPS